MDLDYIIHDLERVIRNEVDDCERAIRAGNLDKARREISDAETKLKRIVASLRNLR